MIKSPAVFIEILLRSSKKKNIIFEEIVIFCFISIFISAFVVTSVFISAIKTTTKTMKPVRQKLINKIRAKTDLYEVIL